MQRLILAIFVLSVSIGCRHIPREPSSGDAAHELAVFYDADPSLSAFLSRSHGYVIFPRVGKGGFVVGGAYGKGWVFEKGRFVGTSELTQLTVGAQIGGKGYAELIVFESERGFQDFKRGNLKFSAQVSAVAATTNASLTAPYRNGVAIFTAAERGLMGELSVGGQAFSFRPSRNR